MRFSETTGASVTEEGNRNVRPVPGCETIHFNLSILSARDRINKFEFAVDLAEEWVRGALVTRAKRRAEEVD